MLHKHLAKHKEEMNAMLAQFETLVIYVSDEEDMLAFTWQMQHRAAELRDSYFVLVAKT